jgi:hypothetical protein
MFDFAVLAEGGAEEADGVAPVVLNFEVEARWGAFDGYQIASSTRQSQLTSTKCMATNKI